MSLDGPSTLIRDIFKTIKGNRSPCTDTSLMIQDVYLDSMVLKINDKHIVTLVNLYQTKHALSSGEGEYC